MNGGGVREDQFYPDPRGPTPERARQGIPDRWLNCPPIGQMICDLFLPFKTPLCLLYDDQVDVTRHFHPAEVFKAKLPRGKKLGLWIDLTNTNRYYSTKEVETRKCKYVKIKLRGHGMTPTEEEVAKFVDIVDDHLTSNPNDVVGVHCTHGFNRTGYLICAYLYKKLDMSVDMAAEEFRNARQPGIYKQDYLEELMKFGGYGEGEINIVAPPRPTWEEGGDEGEDSNGVDQAASTSSGGDRPSAAGSASGPRFMDGLVDGFGTFVTDEYKRKMLQAKVIELCGHNRDEFPGLQPISLDTKNIELLRRKPYMVSWKADGCRYLVYIRGEDEVYAFDRDNNPFHLAGVHFPHRKENRNLRNTLVDAEMIIDQVVENGEKRNQPRLLIYDVITFEGINLKKERFTDRYNCLMWEFDHARREAFSRGRLDRNKEPISVRVKQFWYLSSTHKLFDSSFLGSLGHEIDGLIFQPAIDPYTSGRCDAVLKWKPPSHNSVDFKLRIVREVGEGMLARYVGHLYVQGHPGPFASMKATKTLQQYNEKIIECRYDSEKREWIFMRERTDKSLPNGYRTAMAVCNSIANPITDATLQDFIQKYGHRDVQLPPLPSTHGPPPAKRPRPGTESSSTNGHH